MTDRIIVLGTEDPGAGNTVPSPKELVIDSGAQVTKKHNQSRMG